MTNRDKLIVRLDALAEMRTDGESVAPPSEAKAVKVFTPDAGATWYLSEKDTSDPEDVRYFGMCDLGLGFPELGYVGHDELLAVTGQLGLPVELDEYWDGTLQDGIDLCHRYKR